MTNWWRQNGLILVHRCIAGNVGNGNGLLLHYNQCERGVPRGKGVSIHSAIVWREKRPVCRHKLLAVVYSLTHRSGAGSNKKGVLNGLWQKGWKTLTIFVSSFNAHAKESIPEKGFKNEMSQHDGSGCELASLLSSPVPDVVAMHGPNTTDSFPTKASATVTAQFVSSTDGCWGLNRARFRGKTSLMASLLLCAPFTSKGAAVHPHWRMRTAVMNLLTLLAMLCQKPQARAYKLQVYWWLSK